jgi:hypothetical protein
MPQTCIQLDDGTAQAIEELKKLFNVKTSTGVIRMAVALARVVSRNIGTDETVTIINKKNETVKISLAA